MWNAPENDHFAEEIYLANELVSPGQYQQIGGPRKITLESPGQLPPSFDGRVACYRRVARRPKVSLPAHYVEVSADV